MLAVIPNKVFSTIHKHKHYHKHLPNTLGTTVCTRGAVAHRKELQSMCTQTIIPKNEKNCNKTLFGWDNTLGTRTHKRQLSAVHCKKGHWFHKAIYVAIYMCNAHVQYICIYMYVSLWNQDIMMTQA